MLISLRNPVADKLLILANGDLDRVLDAIRRAAAGRESADLGDVVDILIGNK